MTTPESFVYNSTLVRSWTPTITPAAPMTFSAGPSSIVGEWFVVGNELFGTLNFNSTTATGGSPYVSFTLPVTTIQNTDLTTIGYGNFSDFVNQPIALTVIRDASSARIIKYDASNYALLANKFSVQFRYRIKDV